MSHLQRHTRMGKSESKKVIFQQCDQIFKQQILFVLNPTQTIGSKIQCSLRKLLITHLQLKMLHLNVTRVSL